MLFQTAHTDATLNPEADDAGVNLGKLLQKSKGGQNLQSPGQGSSLQERG